MEYRIVEEFYKYGPQKELVSRFYIQYYGKDRDVLFTFLTKDDWYYITKKADWGGHRYPISRDTLEGAEEFLNNLCAEIPEPKIMKVIECSQLKS